MLTTAPALEAETSERLSKSASDLGGFDWTEEEETALRHKMDWRTVPWVTVLYLLCVCHVLYSPLP